VNIHLYRVEPNAQNANAHMPTRDARGGTRAPSALALDLHYIFTFYGQTDTFEPELMLAAVLLDFEHVPELTRPGLSSAIAATQDLGDSDLDRALARLIVTREMLNLEEFTKVWSIFYQVPYAVSLAYAIRHVRIETDTPARAPLPILAPAVWSAPRPDLRLDRAERIPQPVWGGALEVTGAGLAREDLSFELAGVTLDTGEIAREEGRATIPLTDATFAGQPPVPGVHALRLRAPLSPGAPAHLQVTSNTLPVPIYPALTPGAVNAPGGGATAEGDLTVTIAPPVAPDQSVRLILDAKSPGEGQIVLPAPQRDQTTGTLTFAFAGVPRGDYLARIDVDGMLSPLSVDSDAQSAAFGQFIGPEVTL
jgi:hypothetical protein